MNPPQEYLPFRPLQGQPDEILLQIMYQLGDDQRSVVSLSTCSHALRRVAFSDKAFFQTVYCTIQDQGIPMEFFTTIANQACFSKQILSLVIRSSIMRDSPHHITEDHTRHPPAIDPFQLRYCLSKLWKLQNLTLTGVNWTSSAPFTTLYRHYLHNAPMPSLINIHMSMVRIDQYCLPSFIRFIHSFPTTKTLELETWGPSYPWLLRTPEIGPRNITCLHIDHTIHQAVYEDAPLSPLEYVPVYPCLRELHVQGIDFYDTRRLGHLLRACSGHLEKLQILPFVWQYQPAAAHWIGLPWPRLVKLKRFAIMIAIGMDDVSIYYDSVLQGIIARLPPSLELLDITLYPYETSRRELLHSLQLISWRSIFSLVAAKKIKHIRVKIHFHGETTSWTDRLKNVLISEVQQFDVNLTISRMLYASLTDEND